MLPCIPDHEHTILRLDLVEECPHLLRAGETRLVEQIEMSAGRIALDLALAASGEEALEGGCADSGFAELGRCPRLGCESFDGIAALFCSSRMLDSTVVLNVPISVCAPEKSIAHGRPSSVRAREALVPAPARRG
jgi:hypothetical protein